MISGVCVRRLGLLSAATHPYAGLGSKCPLLARANATQWQQTHSARTESSRAGPNRRRTPRIVDFTREMVQAIILALAELRLVCRERDAAESR